MPMVPKNHEMQCLFLDEDNLCSIHRHQGFNALPSVCKSYPFQFINEGNDRTVVQLSHFCPSIRDNYGEPIADQLEEKFSQAQHHRSTLPESLPCRIATLPRSDYLMLADKWADALELSNHAANSLISMNYQVQLWSENPLEDIHSIDVSDVAAINLADLPTYSPDRLSRIGKAVLFLALIPLTTSMSQSILTRKKDTWGYLKQIILDLTGVLFGKRPVRTLITDRPVSIGPDFWKIEGFDRDFQKQLTAYLATILRQRGIFTKVATLDEVLFLLTLGSAFMTVCARISAAAENRKRINLNAGIAFTDKAFLSHGNFLRALPLTRSIIRMLSALPNSHRRFTPFFLPEARPA